jgi:uncharacterized protein (DUF2235 family)
MTIALETETKDAETETEGGKEPQVFVYNAGVGTANLSSRVIAGALAEGMDEIILDGYMNLIANYSEGDRIYILGFSRGAFAACALASFLSRSGLLKSNSSHRIGDAWTYFIDREGQSEAERKSKTQFELDRSGITYNVNVRFLGLWDAVAGPGREHFYKRYKIGGTLSTVVDKCVHILSMDETRPSFAPRLWTDCRSHQKLEQVWLPGVHTDIGGGYEESYLGIISLLWMIDRLRCHYNELWFEDAYILNQWVDIIKNRVPVINDEWTGYLPPLGRYVGRFARRERAQRRC